MNLASFTRAIVVMDVDSLVLVNMQSKDPVYNPNHPVHHRLPIVIGIGLTPLHVLQVVLPVL